MIDELISILSNSTALAGADQELLDSIDADLEEAARPGQAGPGTERPGALPAQADLHQGQADQHRQARVAARSDHEHGRDYSSTDELLADLGPAGDFAPEPLGGRWPPTAPWPASAAPSPPSACTWPPWTSANTPTTTTTPSAS